MAIRIQAAESQVSGRGPVNVRQTIDAPAAAFGSLNAEATIRSGEQTQKTGTLLDARANKMQDESNALRVMELDSQAQREAMDFIYNPNTGLLTQKGGNALGAQQQAQKYVGDLQKKYTEMAKDNPAVQRILTEKMLALGNSTVDLATRHQFGEYQTYKTDTLSSRQKMNGEAAALSWNDDTEFQKRLDSNNALLIDQGKINGWSVDTMSQKRLEMESAMVVGRIQAMTNTDTPANIMRAKALFDKTRAAGGMSLEAVTKMDSMFDAVLPKAAAQDAYSSLKNQGGLDTLSTDKVFDGMIHRESGGKQFDVNGKPLTSQAGAIGIAQVMPATAPEAAKMAGLEWDEQKYKTDPEYNRKLGQAYFNHQVEIFGNTTLAVMAYNAGGAAVEDFMTGSNFTGKNSTHIRIGDPRKGEVSIDQFVAKFPYEETRKYVTAVAKNAGAGGAPSYDSVITKANEVESLYPNAGKALLTLYNAEAQARTAAEKQTKQAFVDQVAPKIQASNGDWTVLSPDELSQARNLGLMDKITSWKGASDPNLKLSLMTMPADKLAQIDLRDPEYRLALSQPDLETLVKQQKKLGESAGKGTHDRILNAGALMLKSKGINPNPKADDPAGADTLQKFLTAANDQVEAFRDEKKREPSEEELKKIIDPLLLEGTLTRATAKSWSNWDGKDERTGKAYERLPNELFYIEPPDGDVINATMKSAEITGLDVIKQTNPDWIESVDGKDRLSENGTIRYYTKLRQHGMSDDQIIAMYGAQ